MKSVRDVMTSDVVWVSPSARVKTAVILMKGHNIGALPVVHANDAVVGLVTLHSLLGEPQEASVMDMMGREYTVGDPEMSVYDAAEIMNRNQASHLLVMENNRLVGIVSQSDLISELGKTYDPLTGLPWSDSFREWSLDALKRGHEITVILFDLDQFGKFNKKHGHVVGDTVLKEVAEVLKKGIDLETDFACRYGGDEFGIVSVRVVDEAIALAETLQRDISKIKIPELPDGVSGTFGIFGGRRTKEREDMHYAATIDDLITRASKECTAKKPHAAKPEAPVQPLPPEHATALEEAAKKSFVPAEGRAPRLKVQTIGLSMTDAEATVNVILSHGDLEYKREVSGYVVGGKNILRLVAEATAGAACKSLGSGHGIVVDEVLLYDISTEDQIVTVVSTFISPRWSTRNVGSAVVKRGDQYRAAAAALLSSVNRQLESAPQSTPDEFDLPEDTV